MKRLSHPALKPEHYKIAIIGSGPSGLSAAAHAAELGISHILLEAEQQPAHTIRKFQKGKLVMAEPRALPLRSPMSFSMGSRESILAKWDEEIVKYGINLRLGAQVCTIKRMAQGFVLGLATGETIHAEYVVLAIGLQGNIRKLNVPGEDLPRVQYQLDDPDEYEDETIVVVGGGDTGVENALALRHKNHVILINRFSEFVHCKEANLAALNTALKQGEMECRLSTYVEKVESTPDKAYPLLLSVRTPEGTEHIPCHRVIARLGARPPRDLLESFGIQFPSEDPAAVPQLTARYESNVPGLYIVGALAGYPLIKQAMNQGYEVIEHILGRPVEPADEALLRQKFAKIPYINSVEQGLTLIRQRVPLLATLSSLQLRDFMLESDIVALNPGDVVFRRNDYSTSFYCIIEGVVDVYVKDENGPPNFHLYTGEFFGEMGLISGRRRSTTIKASSHCLLLESPRQTMLRLTQSMVSVRRMIDAVSLKRTVQLHIGLSLSAAELDYLVRNAKFRQYAAGEVIWHQGDKADGLYLVRSGSVAISRLIGGREVVLSYVSAGNYFGEMALITGTPRQRTARAAVNTEVVILEAERVAEMMERNPDLLRQLNARYLENVRHELSDEIVQTSADSGNLIAFLVQQGIGEATDVLLIDETICTRCDNCEKACAATHDGTSRLDRKTGPVFDQIRVPSSCRHCEHPHCMKDCPPDAIRRSVDGEVFINDTCIGCGNCVVNCPYDVIQLASVDSGRKPPSLWQWLLFGRGPEPGGRAGAPSQNATKIAVKCDMCKDLADGPACVRSCPTGAAIRVSPQEFLDYAVWRKSKVG
ncbi:MAG: cyclic nucleotide-binding domain-containing protein [Methylophilaceae bacterium]|nr:cyclic nucleotide-binding domain-containing protein [Methylophilaceae bacterium]